MIEKRELLAFHELKVEVEDRASEELKEHMASTLMGQPGSFRYYHSDLSDRMDSGHEDYFLYLRKASKTIGSVGFCGKHTRTLGVDHDSWMIRYFSIKAPMRTTPKDRKKHAATEDDRRRSSVLGRFVQPLFSNPSLLRADNPPQGPALIYAIIDRDNLRSMNFSEQRGLETVGIMEGFSFSRLNPRLSEDMFGVKKNEQEEVLDLIKDFYTDFTLFFSDPVFKDDDYYVLRKEGKIVAGAQCYPVAWDVVDYGSPLVNRLMSLLKPIPWVRKRLGKERFEFLAFDALYYKGGHEADLYELMESILAYKQRYVGMLMMDKDTDLYKVFESRGKLGPLHGVIGSFQADIRMRFLHMDEKLVEHFRSHPTYIPTFDNS